MAVPSKPPKASVALLLYAVIIAGWTLELAKISAWHLLPLLLWTLPVFVLLLRALARHRHGT